MVDPERITNYNLSEEELEEVLVFWVLVAGKTAKIISKRLDALLAELRSFFPGIKGTFKLLRCLSAEGLAVKLKQHGIGCYNQKAKTLHQLAWTVPSPAIPNLRTVSVDKLETIKGIGRKTSRCFVMHSQKKARCAGLDTHILHFLADLGYDVPKSTPSSRKQYEAIEKLILSLYDRMGRSPADLDLLIWRVYSKHKHLKRRLVGLFSKERL